MIAHGAKELTATLVTRKPVFDAKASLYGFELLSAERTEPGVPDLATSSLPLSLLQLLTRIPLEDLTGTRPVFVRVTENFLRSGPYLDFPAGRICFLLDSSSLAGPGTDHFALGELLGAIRRAGYRVGIQGVTAGTLLPALLPLVDFVGVSTTTSSIPSSLAIAEAARRAGILSCAQQVDDQDAFAGLRDGFELFHGRFYQHRPTASTGGVSTGRLATLQLLSECANPDASLEQFEAIISRDPSLTFRVMQLANSGFTSLPRRLNSVREALVIVGVSNIRNLAMMASLNRIEDQHPELLMNALVRGKVCELLARREGFAPSSAFTAGLLSMLDLFLGVSLEEAAEKASLNHELRAAIVAHEGPLGAFVEAAVGMERAEVDRSSIDAIGATELSTAYLSAIPWAQEVLTLSTP